MAGEWKSLTLDQLYDFSSGLSKPRSAFGSGYPFLSFKDIFYNSAVPQQLSELVNSTNEERSRCSVQRGDVFLTRTSETMDELGMSCVALHDVPDATFNGFTKRLRPKNPRVIAPEYARYHFRAPVFRQAVTSMSSMSTRASLNNEMLSRLSIAFPPFHEQLAIGHILCTLDDKIELNRRMSETLEAMACALFKSWFVDFDPVRAKMEGRWQRGQSLPGLPARLYDVFPDRLVDSELGKIPEGWEIGRLGDVLSQRTDRCTPSEETRSRPYVPIESIAARSLLPSECKSGDEAQSSLTAFRKGDLLFGAMRPYFHKVAIAPFDGTTRTTVFVLRARYAEEFSFAALLLHDSKTVEYATNHSTGSTIPYAVWPGSLEAMPVILPPRSIRNAFDHTARPLLDLIPPTFFSNRTLAGLRDALLPKLISGELRVRDAERFVDEARP